MNVETKPIEVSHAIRANDIGKAIELLEKSPHLLEAETPFGSWLHIAASGGHLCLVAWLLEKGLDIDKRGGVLGGNALNYAASRGHADVVKFLLERGSTMDISEPERNPLFGAIYGGHQEVARLLLNEGIDFRIRYSGPSMKDMDAKVFACERGQRELAELIEHYETIVKSAI